uniref:Glycoside hydrolase family 38 central domain-containing protein n=1 Tax=Euplotes harpa TaxID=151035 RepID=A0A7S3JCC5_9SPIT
MKAGHDFLKSELGYRPTIGWHIDPFGHHSASAALFAEMGFNAWFFARMDHSDKDKRLANKELEWLWRPFNESLGARAEIFTHMMYNHYSAPPGFSFDERSNDSPIIDDKRLETYNIEERAAQLHDYLMHLSEHYRSNHLLVPFGDDFNYMNAQMYFYNLDKLIEYMNKHYSDVNLFYSTPYEYVDAVHRADIQWPTKYDDLFPYSDGWDDYWTGYFTSRATLKGYVREASRDLNSQSVFLALDALAHGKQTFAAFEGLFNQMGVLQHHDAVAGTEKQHVAFDYAKTLTEALVDERQQFLDSYKRVAKSPLGGLALCKAHNSTYADCPTAALDDPAVSEIYLEVVNESNDRDTIAKIPIPHASIALFDDDGSEVDADIICARGGDRDCYMYFPVQARLWTRLGYTLRKTVASRAVVPTQNSGVLDAGSLTLAVTSIDGDVRLEIAKHGAAPEAVLMNYLYYKSYQEDEGQRSGAYIFRPSEPDQKPERFNSFTSYDAFQGKHVAQLRLYGDQVVASITGNALTDFVDIETQLLGIPLSKQGQEVVLHLSFAKIANGGVFYTDSMGLEMQKRVLNYRPTWALNVTQPVAGNYYPVAHGVTIRDAAMTLEVLNDRNQGASSLQDGAIEFMVQRRTYRDDSRGVGEALNETDPHSLGGRGLGVTTRHLLRFYNNTESHSVRQDARWMQRELDVPLIYVFGTSKSRFALHGRLFGGATDGFGLPDCVKAVFLPEKDGSLFARFENILDLLTNSQAATIDVRAVAEFIAEATNRKLETVFEVSNSGLFNMIEMSRVKLKWKGLDYTTPNPDYSSDPSKVELTPQRIRSFVFKFSQNANEYLTSC